MGEDGIPITLSRSPVVGSARILSFRGLILGNTLQLINPFWSSDVQKTLEQVGLEVIDIAWRVRLTK
jgi:hypothetical protein